MFGTGTAKAGLYIMGTFTELIGNTKENFRKRFLNSWHLWILDTCEILREIFFFEGKYILVCVYTHMVCLFIDGKLQTVQS